MGAVYGQSAGGTGSFCVNLEDPAGCAERRAGLCAGGEHSPLRLDEATASLDVENETAVQEALSRLIKDKTVLIIAHRMRTVSSADEIVVLKDGEVAEQGSPAQLLDEGGIFAHMVQLQTASQGWTLTKA